MRLVTSDTNAAYTEMRTARIRLFMRGQTLLAQRFDAADVSVVGAPFSVAEGVVTPTGARYPRYGHSFQVLQTAC